MALEFSMSVQAWVDKVKGKQDEVFRSIATDTVAMLQGLTPVKTGYLRANWTIVLNDDPIPVEGRVENPAQVISRLTAGDTITIVNPVVYAARINYGFVGTDSLGRHYNQPGRHMLEQTITALPEIAQRAIERASQHETPVGAA